MKRLFWDIEVSPNVVLSWNIGNKLSIGAENIVNERAIICIAYKWEHDGETKVLTWDKRQNDRAMLKAFLKIVAQADELVAHNGDRFDLKWLRTRCLFHGLDISALREVKTVDTLKIAWSKFRFNNSRLDYIAKFLGLAGKTSTGYKLWRQVVLDNDREALLEMAGYCINDVAVLEAVFEKLGPSGKPTSHAGVLKGAPRWSCPFCGSTNVVKSKTRVTGAGVVSHQMQCKDCGSYFTISEAVFKLYKKAKR